MTKTEPVVLFSGLAGLVGLGLHWMLPDAVIPDELIVAVVFVIACIARRYVTPGANLPDAEVLERARRAVAARRRGTGTAAAILLALLLAPSWAAASSMLHCEEWPHWRKAYDDLGNYDHTGGEAIQWLQLAGCPPVWAESEGRWLPNGSACDAPCEFANRRVRRALENPDAVEGTISGTCAPACIDEPTEFAAGLDLRREPLTFTVNIDTRREVREVETAPDGDGKGGCGCSLQVQSGDTGQCYAPEGVAPEEWMHVTSSGDARAEWISARRPEGQFRAAGRGRMTISYLSGGERVQCETVLVTKTPWQIFVDVATDPRAWLAGGAACILAAHKRGGVWCGLGL